MKLKSFPLALLLVLFANSAQAAFWMNWPVKCTVGLDCLIQNYPDHDQGVGAKDFACGSVTYDGHDGTDIRLLSLASMRAGVPVYAPANGYVIGLRDGVEDKTSGQAIAPSDGTEDAAGKECGNGVHISHGRGYTSQLCHMLKGSITVKAMQKVKAGEKIGMIGLSGNTEFPHLHITVWKDKVAFDPFTRQPVSTACTLAAASSEAYGFWRERVPYQSTAVINSGFFNAVPSKDVMRDTPVNMSTLPANTPALTFWADIMGVQAGDTMTLRITGPDGRIFAENEEKFTKPLAQYFVYIGRKNSSGALILGHYTALISLKREGTIVPAIAATRGLTIN